MKQQKAGIKKKISNGVYNFLNQNAEINNYSNVNSKRSIRQDYIDCKGNYNKLKDKIREQRPLNASLNALQNEELLKLNEEVSNTTKYLENIINKTSVFTGDNCDKMSKGNLSLDEKESGLYGNNMDKWSKQTHIQKITLKSKQSWNNSFSQSLKIPNIYSGLLPMQSISVRSSIDSQFNRRWINLKIADEVSIHIKQNAKNIYEVNKKLQEEISDWKKQWSRYSSYESSIKELMKELKASELHRIQLHNYIQNLRGNIRVYCRVKPQYELDIKTTWNYPEVAWNTSQPNIMKNITAVELKNQTYHYDKIFPECATQADIFTEIKPYWQSALDGDNICIFAYGATGTGKTYTMQGPIYSNNTSMITEMSGILPRSADFIFDQISQKMWKYEKNSGTLNFINTVQISLSMSAIEIYNENIYDLFDTNSSKEPLAWCGSTIKGVITHPLATKEEMVDWCEKASKTRRCESTNFNDSSSRSHAVFIWKIHFEGEGLNSIDSVLNIIDWAGSEKCGVTAMTDKDKKEIEKMKKIQTETSNINKSLTTWGRVMSMLVDKKSNKQWIPYRDSKLTMILKTSWTVSSKTILIVTLSPLEKDINQTKESLNFASNAILA